MKAVSDPTVVWDDILSLIAENVNSQSFETWFRPTRLADISDGSITIEGPNQFFTDWLSEHHMGAIMDASEKKLGFRPQVHFSISGGEDGDQAKAQGRRKHKFFRRYTQNNKTDNLMLNPRYTFSEFVVGPSNRMAQAASLAVAEKPGQVYNPLFIYGGVGLGKTHLAQAIGHFVLEENRRARVCYASSESFVNELIFSIRKGKTLEFKEKYRNIDLLIIDDIQFLAGKESTQEEFFHTFNALYNMGKQIVLTCDRPPKELKALEERLISRFEWGLITDIQNPDLETRMAILKKKTENDGLSIPDDVLYLIADNVRSNIRELEGSLIRLLAFASLTGSDISLDLARETLHDFIRDKKKQLNVREIQKRVAERFEISVDQMISQKRSSEIVLPRQVAIYLSRKLTDKSLVEIGRLFGGRDHTTVIHACKKIENSVKDDADLKRNLTEMEEHFRMSAS